MLWGCFNVPGTVNLISVEGICGINWRSRPIPEDHHV